MANYDQPDVVQKRVRFFDGQFLTDQDFIDEQKFHLDREHRQSRLLRFSGISTGLTVTGNGPYQVVVTAGSAVDDGGRHLVLAADAELRLTNRFAGQQDIEVHLVHQRIATDIAQTGGKSARRWDESPKIAAVAPDGTVVVIPDSAEPTWDGPAVLLARLAVGENGDVTVDPAVAAKAGLAVPGAVGIGTTSPGSDLDIGNFDATDRYLTFKVAGGHRYRSGIELWTEQENRGCSITYDDRLGAGTGLHVRTHQDDPDGTTRLFVGADGDVGIGTAEPENAEGWTRTVDILGGANAKLSVRSSAVDARVLAHDAGFFGAPAGMIVGTASANALSLITGGAARLTVSAAGDVNVGTGPSNFRLSVGAAANHLQLVRESAEPAAGPLVFLELFQQDAEGTGPQAYPSLRFHHQNQFWHRVEARNDGLHLLAGDGPDDYRDLYAGTVAAEQLRLGSTTIGEGELQILQKLAAGTLLIEIFNIHYQGWAFASSTRTDASNWLVASSEKDSFPGHAVWRLQNPR